MDLLIVPVPLFNKEVAVEAYYLRHQKGNDILEAANGIGGDLDGAMFSPPLEMLNLVGIEALTMGKPTLIPIDHYMALTQLELQCRQPPDKIIFLLDEKVKAEQPYIENIQRLRDLGFRFAIQRITSAEQYAPILALCDYIMYDCRNLGEPEQVQLYKDVTAKFPGIFPLFTHIGTMDLFQQMQGKFNGWFEGRFYRTPFTKGEQNVSPLKVNQINLLNIVGNENFEFSQVAKIIEQDTALTISLLRMINSPYMGMRNKVKTIGHAVTMLGQMEVRKWITTAVSKMLASDKPSEVERLSLVRAKFCESLAWKFGLKQDAESLFLMGLFSVLDVILALPMQEALQLVHVSDPISDALVKHEGEYAPIYDFLLQYESANWKAVCRALILHDLTTEDVYQVYVDALCWYRDLISGE